jgi:hypothetical protein
MRSLYSNFPPMTEKSTVIHLHKDERMRQAKSQPKSQPHQLDLFKMMFNERFSNSVEFYQSLPDLYS